MFMVPRNDAVVTRRDVLQRIFTRPLSVRRCAHFMVVSMGWAAEMFDAAADWDLWLLLAGVLVLCWGLVLAATATLFGSSSDGRLTRTAQGRQRTGTAGSDKAAPNHSQRGGLGHA